MFVKWINAYEYKDKETELKRTHSIIKHKIWIDKFLIVPHWLKWIKPFVNIDQAYWTIRSRIVRYMYRRGDLVVPLSDEGRYYNAHDLVRWMDNAKRVQELNFYVKQKRCPGCRQPYKDDGYQYYVLMFDRVTIPYCTYECSEQKAS